MQGNTMNTWHMRPVPAEKKDFSRIAVNVPEMAERLHISRQMLIDLLRKDDNIVVRRNVNIAREAEKLVGNAEWKRFCRIEDAPRFVDCSTTGMYVWGKRGISLPRRPIEQYDFCAAYGSIVRWSHALMESSKIRPGDLWFVSGPKLRGYADDPRERLHVCIDIGRERVVCATNSELGNGVVKLSYADLFASGRKFKGIMRVHPDPDSLTTFEFPNARGIQSPDSLFWIAKQKIESRKPR